MSRVGFALRGAALAALLPLAGALAQGGARDAAPDADGASAATDVQSLLGMALTVSGNERDTLGLLVAVVTPGGPADRAGVEEGSRLAEINGVALRVAPASAGQRSAGDAVQRRLSRTLADVQAGDEVTLQTYRGGRYRTLTLAAGGAAVSSKSATYAAPVEGSAPAQKTAAAPGVTLASVLRAMDEIEGQLHQLSLAGDDGALGDSLIQAEQELGDLRLRLRAAEAREHRRANHVAPGQAAPARAVEIPGIKLGAVDQELAAYYGDGSEAGVLVLEAEDTWAPLRAGDVLLTVNGARADGRQLAEAIGSQRPVRLELLRRRKPLSLVMQPRD